MALKKYGILAYPAGHSLSPAMHNAAFKAAGIDAKYEVCEIKPEDLDVFMNKVRGGAYAGLSVSLPYKEAVMGYLDGITRDAKEIGAVNTILVEDGKLRGANTDWIGALEAFKERVPGEKGLRGKNVVILGAGGSARAIAYALLKEEAKVVVLNRTMDKAQRIADDFARIFGDGKIRYSVLEGIENFDPNILVQATSIWIKEGLDARIIPPNYLRGLGERPIVMDIVYSPRITPLIFEADEEDCTVITGDKMLLNQAVKQFELWTGKKAPVEEMRAALMKGIS